MVDYFWCWIHFLFHIFQLSFPHTPTVTRTARPVWGLLRDYWRYSKYTIYFAERSIIWSSWTPIAGSQIQLYHLYAIKFISCKLSHIYYVHVLILMMSCCLGTKFAACCITSRFNLYSAIWKRWCNWCNKFACLCFTRASNDSWRSIYAWIHKGKWTYPIATVNDFYED